MTATAVSGRRVTAFAPGRVNLIGEHTDYTGGLAMPMAIDLGTTVMGTRVAGGSRVLLRSDDEIGDADLPLTIDDPSTVMPPWARYVAGVVKALAPTTGFTGTISSTVPIGSGLSSSASLELAVALAMGFDGTPLDLARLTQHAEHLASGVPCGIMDQLASAAGRSGHALLIDFTTLEIEPVSLPTDAEIVVVHSGQSRTLAGSAYAERRAACEHAAAIVGPLRDASLDDLVGIADLLTRRRARHVVTENARVRSFARALLAGDLPAAGAVLGESHASLRDDFDVSTPALDALVGELESLAGVHGARLTGAGFGGCAIALANSGAIDPAAFPNGAWRVQPSDGAHVSAASPDDG